MKKYPLFFHFFIFCNFCLSVHLFVLALSLSSLVSDKELSLHFLIYFEISVRLSLLFYLSVYHFLSLCHSLHFCFSLFLIFFLLSLSLSLSLSLLFLSIWSSQPYWDLYEVSNDDLPTGLQNTQFFNTLL